VCSAVQEARDAAAPHEADGLELLDRGVHRVEAVGRQLEGADRLDPGDEEDEPSRQVALSVLVLGAGFGIAQAAVVGAAHGLATAPDADGPARAANHRHGRVTHTVAGLAVRGVLRPEASLVGRPRHQFMRHHRLPRIGRKDHREAVQPLHPVAPVFPEQVRDLPRDLRVREVLPTHREVGDVLRRQRVLQVRRGVGDLPLDGVEALALLDAALVDGAHALVLGRAARQHLDAGTDAASHRDAGCRAAQQCRRCRRTALHHCDGTALAVRRNFLHCTSG
jgi:hypothetical protein